MFHIISLVFAVIRKGEMEAAFCENPQSEDGFGLEALEIDFFTPCKF